MSDRHIAHVVSKSLSLVLANESHSQGLLGPLTGAPGVGTEQEPERVSL